MSNDDVDEFDFDDVIRDVGLDDKEYKLRFSKNMKKAIKKCKPMFPLNDTFNLFTELKSLPEETLNDRSFAFALLTCLTPRSLRDYIIPKLRHDFLESRDEYVFYKDLALIVIKNVL
jgi:hypothetical protein